MYVPLEMNLSIMRRYLQMQTLYLSTSEKFSLYLFCKDDIINKTGCNILSLLQIRVFCCCNYTVDNCRFTQVGSIKHKIIAKRIIPVPIKIEMYEACSL